MPAHPKSTEHTSTVNRVYTQHDVAKWWSELTAMERGKIIERVMRNSSEFLDEVTWKKVD